MNGQVENGLNDLIMKTWDLKVVSYTPVIDDAQLTTLELAREI